MSIITMVISGCGWEHFVYEWVCVLHYNVSLSFLAYTLKYKNIVVKFAMRCLLASNICEGSPVYPQQPLHKVR